MIFAPSSSLLQIWSPSSSSSSSSDFVERQKIEIPSSRIFSLCHLNRNDSKRIEFASGHENGQIMIWSKQQQLNESNHYSSIRTLQTFNNDHSVNDLIFINDNEFNCLISCCREENKIKIFKGEREEEEELKHEKVRSLIPMSNGQFASGGLASLKIWSPSS